MMRYILLILLLTSCTKKYVLRPKISGSIYNKNRIPINDVEIVFIDCLNSDCNGEKAVYSDEKGRFVIKKEIITYLFNKPHKYKRPYYSHTMIIKKEGYKTDTVDIRKWKVKNNIVEMDSIILNLIKK
ncbi:hypothetical protein [Tenacibaculum maritimum]|uniref:Lipoprotein n=4 Tax=Tenacibaculum maritimum TaxID=107401 RepID=A0A2H1E830_9FLAO|nr:hypothetical protein [Tenacibaculum maritimum]MCD9583412.1 hypothetical protein [Tenacibaculum maritimum]MCD9610651.1 hypothetical protein [Tenacibaculum maritimum]MCD9637490.1 hypothetical protein [Tenacibaculum maritimum]QCD63493.1 hypothetical protein B9C57_13550 [Tenacibaculum maritimum]CAA0167443.1 conserved hypothetical protein [Tenacibaculum maritimum]